MCSAPPRYYNLINRQAGCPLNLPSQSGPVFLLPLRAVLGPMDRGSFVLLILPAGLLVLESVLVLLAVGHGGALKKFKGRAYRRVAYVPSGSQKAVQPL